MLNWLGGIVWQKSGDRNFWGRGMSGWFLTRVNFSRAILMDHFSRGKFPGKLPRWANVPGFVREGINFPGVNFSRGRGNVRGGISRRGMSVVGARSSMQDVQRL